MNDPFKLQNVPQLHEARMGRETKMGAQHCWETTFYARESITCVILEKKLIKKLICPFSQGFSAPESFAYSEAVSATLAEATIHNL